MYSVYVLCYTLCNMNDSIYDDMALEQMAKKQFGMDIDVDKVIVRRVPVSRTARATVFLTTKKQLQQQECVKKKKTF